MVALTNFKSATYSLTVLGLTIPAYAAIYALLVNVLVAVGATLAFNVVRAVPEGRDLTVPADYL